MGRSPRSPPSSKQDTVGGASWRKPGRTCPDRSWCRTTSPGTSQCGDTDRQTSRNVLLDQHLRAGGEGKEGKLLGKENGRMRGSEQTVRAVARTQPLRAELRSLRVRSVGPSPKNTLKKKTCRKLHDPLDNPHRRCSAWLNSIRCADRGKDKPAGIVCVVLNM